MAEYFQREDFYHILSTHGITLTSTQKEQFQTYVMLLKEWNEKMNLTAITEESAVYEKHFLDCILPSFQTMLQGHICDVGAGAGFPSIPLKIVYPDLQVTIVEPLGKRIIFLTALCKALKIDVELVNERAEDYAKTHREYFDVVTARAVANLPMLAELCIPLVKVSGIFLAMKGSGGFEEHEQAKQAIAKLGCELQDVYHSTLIDGSKRTNLVYHKVKGCPKQYPRAFAAIKKHPL